jgi:RNA polymerase sigma-70 factor (ECF subfamily)
MNPLTADQQDSADMSRLLNGHDAALRDLMDRYAEKLFHYLLRSLQNEDDASDLAQETFVRVYQNREKFDPSQKFTTWLYSIARNLVRDHYRYRSRHQQVPLEAQSNETQPIADTLAAVEPLPDQTLQSKDRADLVRQAVQALPEELKQPLILAVYQELPQAEIAAILHCSVKAVETRIYRARQQLRTTLAALIPAL